MKPEERLEALRALLELIEAEKNPSFKELQGWLKLKDTLNLSKGKHHTSRNVKRVQIKSDVERLIDTVSQMV